jgi:hypothetical protein
LSNIARNCSPYTHNNTFDAQGRRKRKAVNGMTTLYVTDADNSEVLEYDSTSG